MGIPKQIVFIDIETTGLEETSGVYQVSMVTADSTVKHVTNVVNDFLMVPNFSEGYRVPFSDDKLEELSGGASLKDKWDSYHELLWDPGNLIISYNTSFDLRMLTKYSERNNLIKPNWGREIYTIDRFNDRGNFCAMKAASRNYGRGHNIRLDQAVKQFLPSLYDSIEQEFGLFCAEAGISSLAVYHDALFDTWNLYRLIKGNRSWMF